MTERCPATREGMFVTGRGLQHRQVHWRVHCSLPPGHDGEHVAIPDHGQGENAGDYQWIRWTA